MTDVVEGISKLQKELQERKYQKEKLQKKLREIRSDKELPEIDESRLERLIEEEEKTEEQIKNINYIIAELEKDINELTGDKKDKKYIGEVGRKAESVLDEVQNEYEKIEEKRERFENSLDQIDETQNDIENLEETAKGLIERTTSAALGEQFAERKSELESNLIYWKYGSVSSIGLLLISSAIIYIDIISSGSTLITNLSKIALILPISVAVWFTVSNYSRQKRLMEEYEFKARVALSLSGFREVLNKETPEEDDEIVAEFVVKTMDKIYSNPQQNINDESNEDSPLTIGQKPLVEVIKKIGNQ